MNTTIYWPGVVCLFLRSLLAIDVQGLVWELTIGEAVRRPKKWIWERDICGGNSELATELCVGRSGPYIRCQWTTTWIFREHPKNASCFNALVWGTANDTLCQRREMNSCPRELTSVESLAGHWCLTKSQVRKLEELRLEKDMQLSITLLASGLADKAVEEDNKLKTLASVIVQS